MKRLIPAAMRRSAWTAAIVGTAFIVAGSAQAISSGWRVVKSRSVSGQFAATAVSATIKRPNGIAVRLKGGVSSGNAAIACSRGFSISSKSRSYSRAGFFVLPLMRKAESCEVVASVGGSGRVTVQILKR